LGDLKQEDKAGLFLSITDSSFGLRIVFFETEYEISTGNEDVPEFLNQGSSLLTMFSGREVLSYMLLHGGSSVLLDLIWTLSGLKIHRSPHEHPLTPTLLTRKFSDNMDSQKFFRVSIISYPYYSILRADRRYKKMHTQRKILAA